ncbi:MAG: hypothetical protein K0R36_3851 [Chryseobacterium sp.]|jgi:hypothetical protein|nr:hypothetical protein [Chryseobacterium sp.]
MTINEEKIYSDLQNNSFVFFRDFIERITNKDNQNEDYISKELVALSIASLQISIELAFKALVIKKCGLLSLMSTQNPPKSIEELYSDFLNNSIKVLTFERIKTFSKTNNLVDNLDDDDYEIITEFQKYRNGIVHLSFNFDENDYFDLKYDIIYFVVNILIKILCSGDESIKPSEFLEYNLGSEYHKRLVNYRPYISAMEKLAIENSFTVYDCIACSNKTYAKDDDYCYACNFVGIIEHFRNCEFCDEKRSMIYDGLNLELNNNETKAYCLNCQNDTYIFLCPECEVTYNLELFDRKEKCTLEKCINN